MATKATGGRGSSKPSTAGSPGSSSKSSGSKSGSSSKSSDSRSTGSKSGGSKASSGQSNKELLSKLFEDEVKDIYWAEKALTKALPKMAKNATDEELVTALQSHLEETMGHVQRLEQVFEMMGKKAQAKKCEAMNGLIKEAEELMSEHQEGMMRDVAIISAGQKVEHYEIATYGTLKALATILGMEDVAELLGETLEEEKAADEKLTEVTSSIATIDGEEEDEEDEE